MPTTPPMVRHRRADAGPIRALLLVVVALAVLAPSTPAAATAFTAGWSAGWAAAVQPPALPSEWAPPSWSTAGFHNQSIRQVVRVSTGGQWLRIRLSNAYGAKPLRLTGASIGKSGTGAAIHEGSIQSLQFARHASTTIPPAATATSDPVRLRTTALERLTVTLYFAEQTGPATFHSTGLTTTYRATGDHRSSRSAGAFTGETSPSYFYLTGVDVTGGDGRSSGTVVTFGDSITDGYDSTPNADNRYPDELAERLVAAGRPLGVANSGIDGNLLLTSSPCFGEAGVARFRRDALDQPGVRAVIVLLGINDIGSANGPDFGCGSPPDVSAADLITGHRALIRAAHARGVRIIGATLTPFKGNAYYDTEANQRRRADFNEWMRTSGEYDAVIDLDRTLADPADPAAMNPIYASPDRLHPNDAGMTAIAAAVPISRL
ncbi:SGNH/GDSL hydrolase family protein [Dactylosporangium sp. CA-139066]|uniref:SGNH/GDSL hydrolase family protein n=1 Tax=Dactylosporangium sp. CA-139066 TaxID=3239930 RepID=UPI003D92FA2E